jgi:hypothetical protein
MIDVRSPRRQPVNRGSILSFFWDAGDVSESRFWLLALGEGVWRGEEVIQGDRALILFLSL